MVPAGAAVAAVPQFAPAALPAPAAPPAPDLRVQLRGQIEFYFSDENLAKDFYLRQQMSSEGYVPLITLSGFARVRQLAPMNDGGTGIIGLLGQALQGSQRLEIDGSWTKVRRRGDWKKFVMMGP